MRLTNLLIAVLLLFLSQSLKAEEKTRSFGSVVQENPVLMVLLAEGMIGLNAKMASNDPHTYGGVCALLFPVAGAGDGTYDTVSRWVLLGSAEAIAFYNIGVDEDEISEGEVFRDNMKAWHGMFVAGVITGYLTGDFRKKDENTSFSFMPLKEGGHFMLSYKF